MSEWQSAEHAAAYLQRANRVPHRAIAEAVLLEELPPVLTRVLDLGSGDGRLLGLVLDAYPGTHGVALDFSPAMLEALHLRFGGNPLVEVVHHNLEHQLPELGRFDAVVSSFAIHHLEDLRKRELYEEVFAALEPGGTFCNLEHVQPGSARAHACFLAAMGIEPGNEDPSNRLLDVWTQLEWFREIGFVDVDCSWKWRELALLVGRKPAAR